MTAAAYHDAVSVLATWGETVTFSPKNGRSRSITAKVDEDGEGDFNDTTRSLLFTEQISVYVLRDRDDETYGGINAVQLGDTITIEPGEPTERTYSFTGKRSGSDRYAWELQFGATSTYQVGGRRNR